MQHVQCEDWFYRMTSLFSLRGVNTGSPSNDIKAGQPSPQLKHRCNAWTEISAGIAAGGLVAVTAIRSIPRASLLHCFRRHSQVAAPLYRAFIAVRKPSSEPPSVDPFGLASFVVPSLFGLKNGLPTPQIPRLCNRVQFPTWTLMIAVKGAFQGLTCCASAIWLDRSPFQIVPTGLKRTPLGHKGSLEVG